MEEREELAREEAREEREAVSQNSKSKAAAAREQ